MNKDILGFQNKIEDLNEMILLKQREMEWIIRRVLYLENKIYNACTHEWVDFKCKYCNLSKR